MKITGTSTLAAPPQQVWDAVHDPAVLARCLPGCERLTELADDHYAMTVTAGVAAIKGTYDGEVALLEPQPPSSFAMRASGVGAPGTVDALVVVRLAETPGGGTELTYDADASVGGAIGGVGQRMLSGVTRKMAGQFFAALDADIAGVPAGLAPVEAQVASTGELGGVLPAPTPRSFAGRASPTAEPSVREGTRGFALGVVAGGVVALLGVALGARLGRRR
ncbi:carbon monoxide dehydrogenase subunit G [Humibacillus xanthopallidus]|uniref:SRPBCC family protein n=1 Tax=Humibacillus xanthopallidus TaxID=412689 RepID=UPI00384F3CE1